MEREGPGKRQWCEAALVRLLFFLPPSVCAAASEAFAALQELLQHRGVRE